MGFTDTLKRSLGFEETESANTNRDEGEGSFTNILQGLSDEFKREINNLRKGPSEYQPQYERPQQNDDMNPQSTPNPNPNPADPESIPRPTPIYDDYDDYVIVPEQSFYEIVLIRPKSIDDVNYIIDQILEEKNPVIIDLSFLERESPANFKLAGEKIKLLRERYDAQALLLSRCDERNLIIISPKKVKLIKKS